MKNIKNIIRNMERNIHYHLYRWIAAKFERDDEEVNRIIRRIALFKFKRNMVSADVSDIFVIDKTVHLVTNTPGQWIGSKGSIINELRNELGVEVNLIENNASNMKTFNFFMRHLEVNWVDYI